MAWFEYFRSCMDIHVVGVKKRQTMTLNANKINIYVVYTYKA